MQLKWFLAFCCFAAFLRSGWTLAVADDVVIFKEVLLLAKSVVNSTDCQCNMVIDAARKRRLIDVIGTMENIVEAEAVSFPASGVTVPRYNHTQRVKRFSMFGHKKMALPPGTRLTVTPTVFLPFVRELPAGFLSSLTFSLPFTIDFDELGFTDNDSFFGVFPGFQRMMQMVFGSRRPTRAANYNGGHRMLVYRALEDTLYNFGLNGRDCLLRAICEIHESPLHGHGLLGELLQFIFTVSNSPDLGGESSAYIQAESVGRDRGDCTIYHAKCPRSLFNYDDKHGH